MNIFSKYKPSNISEFIADSTEELSKLDNIIKNNVEFPCEGKRSIILHGCYGSGKTALAKMLPTLLDSYRVINSDKDQVHSFGYQFYSCSATGGSNLVQQAMPTTRAFTPSGIHYIVLDEVDNLRIDAQRNMKSFITRYKHVIYLMTTNHIKKIDQGLISRSHCISFERPNADLWKNKCRKIFDDHGIEPNDQWIDQLVNSSKGDARKILSEVQMQILICK